MGGEGEARDAESANVVGCDTAADGRGSSDGGRTRLKQERLFNLLLTTVREARGVGVLSDTR